MENTLMITISLERYNELIRTEARLCFLKDYCKHEHMTHTDLKYYLGIEEETNEDTEPAAE